MKKKYSKPDIMFESFTLSNCVAGACAGGAELLAGDYECGKLFSDGNAVFGTGMTGCTIEVTMDQDGDGQWGEYCYHVPANLLNLFIS